MFGQDIKLVTAVSGAEPRRRPTVRPTVGRDPGFGLAWVWVFINRPMNSTLEPQDHLQCLPGFVTRRGGLTSAATSFLGSRHSLLCMHCDHELQRGGRCRASVLDGGSPLPPSRSWTGRKSARGLAQSKTWRRCVRFMESRQVL